MPRPHGSSSEAPAHTLPPGFWTIKHRLPCQDPDKLCLTPLLTGPAWVCLCKLPGHCGGLLSLLLSQVGLGISHWKSLPIILPGSRGWKPSQLCQRGATGLPLSLPAAHSQAIQQLWWGLNFLTCESGDRCLPREAAGCSISDLRPGHSSPCCCEYSLPIAREAFRIRRGTFHSHGSWGGFLPEVSRKMEKHKERECFGENRTPAEI